MPLGRTASGDCVRSLCLPSGRSIQFKFVVDGDWVTSPCEQLVADGGGNYNNYRLIQPTVRLDWRGPVIAGPVLVTGDWNSYGELVPLQRNPATGVYELRACLPPGTYTYHFLVDDAWQARAAACGAACSSAPPRAVALCASALRCLRLAASSFILRCPCCRSAPRPTQRTLTAGCWRTSERGGSGQRGAGQRGRQGQR